ncbi:MAG: phosphatase PAP2 family protein [Syntrophothermus sp.]
MFQATKGLLWLPLYILFLILILRHYRWQTLLILVSAALMITVSDQLSEFFKHLVQRPRPSHEQGLPVHLVNLYKGGMYGFYSAHASNFFAVALFLTILLKKYYRWFVWFVMVWAAFLAYTRIYLGVHYPGDSVTGMVMGLCLGYFFGNITREVCVNTREWFMGMK